MIKMVLAASLLVVLNVACHQQHADSKAAAAEISYTVVQLRVGWGYSIYRDNKLFIRQEQVQAIPGVVPFASERDADAVAREVVKKLKLGETPRITVQDLQRLQVKY